MKLFEIVLNGPNTTTRTEIVRCESKQILENMLKQCFEIKTSEYFGYTKFEIKNGYIPKIIEVSATISNEEEKSKKYLIKKLEGEIIGCKKTITKNKYKIKKIRGDKN